MNEISEKLQFHTICLKAPGLERATTKATPDLRLNHITRRNHLVS